MFRGGGGPYGIAAITGGTIAGVTGVPIVLSAGGLPFIGLSTGSVAAGGAISGITALPRIYPAAWCYFQANKLAASIAAGFYYCTFSSTTAGTAFLNSYTSGKSTPPASPTAVTAGQGAFTGDTGEEFGLTLTLPALTANAAIEIKAAWEMTNNAGVKTSNIRFSGNAGTIMIAHALASLANAGFTGGISNMGVTGQQQSFTSGIQGVNPSTITALGTVDTTQTTNTLVFSLTRGTATDNLILLPPTVVVTQ